VTENNTDIAFDLVNEIVNSSQKPTAYTDSVNKKTFKEYREVPVTDSKQYQRTNDSQL